MAGWDEIVTFGKLLKNVGAHAKVVHDFALDEPLKGRVEVRLLDLGRVTLSTIRSTGHRMTSVEPDRVTYFSPLAGELRIRSGDAVYHADFGSGLFVRPGKRTSRVVPPAGQTFYGVAVSARPETKAPDGAPPGTEYHDVSRSSAASCLHGFLQYFIRDFARSESLLGKPDMIAAAETLIMACLEEMNVEETSEEGPSLAMMARRVDRAEQIMRERLADALSVEDLAMELDVSPRSLQAAFRTVRGRTPTEVLRQLRLDRAREMLMTAGESPRVTDVALACGMTHFGRFAHAYRLRFGEVPSETAIRAKSAGEAVDTGDTGKGRS
jgi:AraC-like DNA-binding protein